MTSGNFAIGKYCVACGAGLIISAIVCPHCGTAAGRKPGEPLARSKQTAIVLSIFLGFWAFLYTYRVDALKFWIALPTLVLSAAVLVWNEWAWENIWEWSATSFFAVQVLFGGLFFVTSVGSWIAAIVLNVKRDEGAFNSMFTS